MPINRSEDCPSRRRNTYSLLLDTSCMAFGSLLFELCCFGGKCLSQRLEFRYGNFGATDLQLVVGPILDAVKVRGGCHLGKSRTSGRASLGCHLRSPITEGSGTSRPLKRFTSKRRKPRDQHPWEGCSLASCWARFMSLTQGKHWCSGTSALPARLGPRWLCTAVRRQVQPSTVARTTVS
jgi:hypothetical protein